MITLSNGIISAEISELGAELKSLKKDGIEYMWQGDPQVWDGTAPILFPITGSLRDDKYFFEGKEYSLSHHGFARTKTFTVETKTAESVTLLLQSDEDTLKCYPFEFEFRVTYTIKNSALEVGYNIKNIDNKRMYFSVGSHEAYAIPEGVEDYDIIFP